MAIDVRHLAGSVTLKLTNVDMILYFGIASCTALV